MVVATLSIISLIAPNIPDACDAVWALYLYQFEVGSESYLNDVIYHF